MSVIVQERFEAVKDIPLSVGGHDPPNGAICGACVMEKFAWMTGQNWTDHPENCSAVIGAFLRGFNDYTDQPTRDRLDEWVIANAERLVATASDGREEARGFMAADFACRVALPPWLDLAGAEDAAEELRRRPIIESRELASETRDAVNAIRQQYKWPDWYGLREGLRRRVREAVRKALDEKKEAAEAAWAAEAAGAAGAAEAAEAAEAAGAAGAAEAAEAAEAAWAAEAAEAAWAAEAAGPAWAAFRAKIRQTFEAKFKELYGERFGPTQVEIRAAAFELLDRMLEVTT